MLPAHQWPYEPPRVPLAWLCVWAPEMFPPPRQAGRQGAGMAVREPWERGCEPWARGREGAGLLVLGFLMTLFILAANPAGSDPLAVGSANAACGTSLPEPAHGPCAKTLV